MTCESVSYRVFQEEGGIGYADVTGVQTCALPISRSTWCARASRLPLQPLEQRAQLGRHLHAEHVLHRRRDDERARSSGALRARGPRGAVLAGRAIGGVRTAAGGRGRGPPAPPAALFSGPPRPPPAPPAPAA